MCENMKWDQIPNKQTLIRQGVKKIRMEVIRRSVNSWSNRVYRMLSNKCNYVLLNKIHSKKIGLIRPREEPLRFRIDLPNLKRFTS